MNDKFVEEMIQAQREVLLAKGDWAKKRAEDFFNQNFLCKMDGFSKTELDACLAKLKKIHLAAMKQINDTIYEAEMYGYDRTSKQSAELANLIATKKAIETLMASTNNLVQKNDKKSFQKNNTKHLRFGR